MIKNDFKIDFEKKKIFHVGKNKPVYSAKELYSFLQDLFDEPKNMKYEIPIVAETQPKAETNFKLINGWTIDKQSQKHLQGAFAIDSH